MRKFIILLLLTSCSFFYASAQFNKGEIYTGIDISRRIARFDITSIQSSVSIGLGQHSRAGIFYNRSWYGSYNNWTDNSIKIHGAGVFYEYASYFKKSRKWGWTMNGSFAFNQVSVYEKNAGTVLLNNRYTERQLTFTPGIFFKPSPRVMLFANIGGFSLNNNRNEFINARSDFATKLNIGAIFTIGHPRKRKLQQSRF